MTQQVAVVDYGMGNLHSVRKALQHVAEDADICMVQDAESLLQADRVVFPGQGAARDCMQALRDHQLIDALKEVMATRPVLGICMGMQVLLEATEENDGQALMGVIPGHVRRFPASATCRVPHMGWNTVRQQAHPMWQGIADNSHFYFVHSYHVAPEAATPQVGVTGYGADFVSALAFDKVFAVQFHPEKSQQLGLHLLSNFMSWNP